MGLAASQARYLALTARKSDLEFQSQTINTRRIQLAYRTAEIAQAYTEGMNNRQIAQSTRNKNGDLIWKQASYGGMLSTGFVVIPMPGKAWGDINTECPYDTATDPIQVPSGFYNLKSGVTGTSWTTEAAAKAALGVDDLDDYCDRSKSGDTTTWKLKDSLTEALYEKLADAIKGKYDRGTVSDYGVTMVDGYTNRNPNNAWDLQNLLESGDAQIITKEFYNYLIQKGYDPTVGKDDPQYTSKLDIGKFYKLQEEFKNNEGNCNVGNKAGIVDWRADETETFSQRSYTEDDAKVLAKYEAETAEVQAQDKILEAQEKNIETQHKAIETELEAIQKVIQNNIDKTFKIFS